MSANVELYWIPGCSSCLRMKEFVEAGGVPFESINVDEQPERARRLTELGASAPVAAIGDRWVNGGDLRAVAELLGIAFEDRQPLPPGELLGRYHSIVSVLLGLLDDAPPWALELVPPTWEWTLRDIAHHAGCVMRVFLSDYDPESYLGESYEMNYETNRAPKETETLDELIANAIATQKHVNRWWDRDGHDDPLDRIVLTYWGHQPLHAAFEREVWHTAQHVRQVQQLLEESDVVITCGLTPRILADLPLPERVFV